MGKGNGTKDNAALNFVDKIDKNGVEIREKICIFSLGELGSKKNDVFW